MRISTTRLRVETEMLKATMSIQVPRSQILKIASLGKQAKFAAMIIAMNNREFNRIMA